MIERLFRSAFVPVALAGVLLLSAFLKGYELATEELSPSTFLRSRWFLTLVVMYEVALAALLAWQPGGCRSF